MAIRRCTLRSALPVLAFVSALALSGCSGGADAESQGPPTASPTQTPYTSEPTPATSNAPARNIKAPEMPNAAKQNTKAGLEAFARHFVTLVDYGYKTGDTAPIEQVSKADCSTCRTWSSSIRSIYEDGWTIGSEVTTVTAETKFEDFVDGSRSLTLMAHQSDFTVVNRKGSTQHKAANTPSMELLAKYENGSWIVLDLGRPR